MYVAICHISIKFSIFNPWSKTLLGAVIFRQHDLISKRISLYAPIRIGCFTKQKVSLDRFRSFDALSCIVFIHVYLQLQKYSLTHYLFNTGNTEPTAECNDGYYCTLGAYTSTPTDGVTGDICPPGRYCGTGSVTGEPCPIGTFSNIEGLSNETQCEDCTPGFYCGRTGLTTESGTCWAGECNNTWLILPNCRTNVLDVLNFECTCVKNIAIFHPTIKYCIFN